MSDEDVAALLDSEEPLVVIEAPAGCGKTYQGAGYAGRAAARLQSGRILILTHTHAACGVFDKTTRASGRKVEIRTIDSLIVQIASAYHKSLALPADVSAWARQRGNSGFSDIADRVARLLSCHPMICEALVQRYPVLIGDEHQDSSAAQHAIILALHNAGAIARIFGDPMQRIYGSRTPQAVGADRARWEELKAIAAYKELQNPHRWSGGSPDLGHWILRARETLKAGSRIDLTGTLPNGLAVLFAENISQSRTGYALSAADRAPLDGIVDPATELLVLTGENDTVSALAAFWDRRIPIWEGHTRDALGDLVTRLADNAGNAAAIAQATVDFLSAVAVGCSPSSHGNRLISEVNGACTGRVRPNTKPAYLQQLGRYIVEEPKHTGVARCLEHLSQLIDDRIAGFTDIKIDHRREYRDAVRLLDYEDAGEGLAEINRRRSFARPMPPKRAISTIHKAKGLECDNAVVLPCDRQRFSNSDYSRCKLYVALSRAKQSLTLVLPRSNPSPLFDIGR